MTKFCGYCVFVRDAINDNSWAQYGIMYLILLVDKYLHYTEQITPQQTGVHICGMPVASHAEGLSELLSLFISKDRHKPLIYTTMRDTPLGGRQDC